MAIINNNVQNVKFLRNQDVNITRDVAISLLNTHKEDAADGTALLARYTVSGEVKTIVGFVYVTGSTHDITIFDTEGASGDVEELRQEINAKLGEGITSENTATAQLTALSGTSADASGVTSVWGAKAYADDLIGTLDYTDTAETGSYVSKVDQVDGKITTTKIALPSVNAISETGKPITAVSESLGAISATAGKINAEYVNVADTEEKFSATTVEGVLAELKDDIDDVIDGLDYTDTAVTGSYVSEVNESNGVISVTRVALPTVAAISGAGQAITAVSESLGEISAVAGDIAAAHVTIADAGGIITAEDVEGALAEIAAEIDAMDKEASAVDGQVVTTVSEVDGVVSETKANVKDLQLGGYVKGNDTGDIASADTINVALSKLENKAAAITILDEDKSINVTPTTSGTNISVNIKSGEHVLAKDGNAGVYTDIKLSAVTPSSTAVKEEYSLVGTDGSVLGTNIKIYKDSHIVSITYITDSSDPHYQNLEYVYIDASGDTQTEYVDISSLVLEAEFASGVTITDHIAHGVVDPASEKDSNNDSFLTVGADGFKVDGIKAEITANIEALDAVVTGGTTAGTATSNHVQVIVGEADGKLTGVTVTETNIANADDLAELSGKTITAITSTNSSITTSINDATGNKTVDIQTDADKIKMSGFSADNTSSLSGIAESDSIATAFEKTNTVITENEKVTAEALTDLDDRINTVSGDVETIKNEYISGVSVNGNAVTVANKVAPISITPATSAVTATSTEAIVVNTDNSGNITLGLATIDCGFYD